MSGSIVLSLTSRMSPRKRAESLRLVFGKTCRIQNTVRGLEVSTTLAQALDSIRRALGPTARIHQEHIAGLVETQVRIGRGVEECVACGIIGENWARLVALAVLRADFPE